MTEFWDLVLTKAGPLGLAILTILYFVHEVKEPLIKTSILIEKNLEAIKEMIKAIEKLGDAVGKIPVRGERERRN